MELRTYRREGGYAIKLTQKYGWVYHMDHSKCVKGGDTIPGVNYLLAFLHTYTNYLD